MQLSRGVKRVEKLWNYRFRLNENVAENPADFGCGKKCSDSDSI